MMRHRTIWLLALAAALAGCATSTEIRGPGGQVSHLIDCSGAAVPLGACYEKANELCPTGYNVVDAQQSVGPMMIGPYGGAQMQQKHIVVSCAN